MSTTQSVETGAAVVAKASPPITVSIATLAGYNVSELLLWATLIYTALMIGHKMYAIATDVIDRRARAGVLECRVGATDKRDVRIERRAGEL